MGALRLRFLHKAASVGSFTALTTPALSGDPVVGQRIRATNGTYSLTPDSITPYWALDGAVDSTVTGDNYLIDDSAVGSVVGYGEIAHRTGKPDTSLNVATSTAAVTDIDLTNAITAFTRTSASGVTPITFSLTYGSNVYEGYVRRWKVYSDSAKSDLLLTTDGHVLTYDDLQPGAVIDLADEGVSYTATDWIEAIVEATSPAAIFHDFTYSTAISPTDASIAMVWSATDKTGGMSLSGGNLVITQAGSQMDTIRGSRAVGYDLTYWEVTAGIQYTEIGVADSSVALPAPNYWGMSAFGRVATAHACGWHGNDNQLYYNNTGTAIGAFGASDRIGVALDRVNKKIWFRKNNGSWLPSGNPALGTGGQTMSAINSDIYPMVEAGGSSTITANFGTTPGGTAGFTDTPPTGFVAP